MGPLRNTGGAVSLHIPVTNAEREKKKGYLSSEWKGHREIQQASLVEGEAEHCPEPLASPITLSYGEGCDTRSAKKGAEALTKRRDRGWKKRPRIPGKERR